MAELIDIVFAGFCRSTHHKLAIDALRLLQGRNAAAWRDVFLVHHKAYLAGAKAPDDVFRDSQNQVLHVGKNYWGGAEAAAEAWRARLIESLKAERWDDVAFSAGVLSHYISDPMQPLHTDQTEVESVVHQAFERACAKSYRALKKRLERDLGGYPELPEDKGPGSAARRTRAGAEFAYPFYNACIDRFDLKRSLKAPEQALDDVLSVAIAQCLGRATRSYALILDDCLEEAKVAPPKVDARTTTFLAQLEIPIQWVLKNMADAKDAAEVRAIYAEFYRTGKVIDKLSDDDRAVRMAWASDILKVSTAELNAMPLARVPGARFGALPGTPEPGPIAVDLAPAATALVAPGTEPKPVKLPEEVVAIPVAATVLPPVPLVAPAVAALGASPVVVPETAPLPEPNLQALDELVAPFAASDDVVVDDVAPEDQPEPEPVLEVAAVGADAPLPSVEPVPELAVIPIQDPVPPLSDLTAVLEPEAVAVDALAAPDLVPAMIVDPPTETPASVEVAALEPAPAPITPPPVKAFDPFAPAVAASVSTRADPFAIDRPRADVRPAPDVSEAIAKPTLDDMNPFREAPDSVPAPKPFVEPPRVSRDPFARPVEEGASPSPTPDIPIAAAPNSPPAETENAETEPTEAANEAPKFSRRTILKPTSPLVDAPGLGQRSADRLGALGIETIADLLAFDAPSKSTRLRAAGLGVDMVGAWQGLARLALAIPGVRSIDAQLLWHAGLRDIAQLSRMKANDVHAKMVAVAQSPIGERFMRSSDVISLAQVEELLSQIRASNPGL